MDIEEVKQPEVQKAKKKIDKKTIIAGVALLAMIIAGAGYSYNKKKQEAKQKAVSDKAITFIKENLVQAGTDVQLTKIEKEGSLYKLTLSINKQEIISYMNPEGTKFFPQAIDVDKKDDKSGSASKQTASEAENKTQIPEVDLFVMSQCPYGIQAEKGILPAIQKLGAKVNFKLKFVDYILHGKKEFDENLNQYCIQKEEPAKLDDYLACYVKSGNASTCLASAKINKAKVSSCVSSTDSSLKLTDSFNSGGQNPPFAVDQADNDTFGVQGSPTLVVNGTVINAGRDSASMLKAICSGFEKQPEECKAQLSSATPAAGFGEGAAATGGSASCGQ